MSVAGIGREKLQKKIPKEQNPEEVGLSTRSLRMLMGGPRRGRYWPDMVHAFGREKQ